tara:strand:- start:292 stop:591 length:300 start_codon:yes stop_codon:yes gene_type:complete
MSLIMVAIISIKDDDKYLEYQNKVLPMFEELGVEVLAVDDSPKPIEGETRSQRIVVLRFADKEEFNSWYESEAYKAIKPIRLNASNGEVHLLQERNLRF